MNNPGEVVAFTVGNRQFIFDAVGTMKDGVFVPSEPRCHVIDIGPRGGRRPLLSWSDPASLRKLAKQIERLADAADRWYEESSHD